MEAKNLKIIGAKLTCRSAFATKTLPDGEEVVYEVAQKGNLVMAVTLLGDDGKEVEVPVDLLYSLPEEGESLLTNGVVLDAIARFAFKATGTTISREDIFSINGGSGWRLSMRLTKMVRRMLVDFDEVPVSWHYSHKLAASYTKKKMEGRKPKKSTFEKIKYNPHVRIREWLEALKRS
jgi:hypothetical protein